MQERPHTRPQTEPVPIDIDGLCGQATVRLACHECLPLDGHQCAGHMKTSYDFEDQISIRFQMMPSEVYGLWFRKRCIYVGKAQEQPIARRLEQHWRGSHNSDLDAWVKAKGAELRVSYRIIRKQSAISDLEEFYIKQFQPLTNKLLK